MPEITITKIYFVPPVAIARLGASPVPLEAFSWAEDPNSFGAGQTIIVPQVSLQVLPDGSIDPYLPRQLQFKDEGMVRPVCPFFELHAIWNPVANESISYDQPLTPTLLNAAGLDLASVSFTVTAVNRKAAFRTKDDNCLYEARGLFPATDYGRHELRAYTHSIDGSRLVFQDHPIPLGSFQIIRPGDPGTKRLCVVLDTIRVRFVPARGEVYGPPSATRGQTDDSRSSHIIVPKKNRILNPAASWSKYVPSVSSPPSQPYDTYDGESDLDISPAGWGVVDDTCEVLIQASLATGMGSPANARVFVGPPHYAPDRRHFYSLMDELSDREPLPKLANFDECAKYLEASDRERKSLPKPPNFDEYGKYLEASVTDLFRRILETASLINVDRQRNSSLEVNERNQKNPGQEKILKTTNGLPATNKLTMTVKDKVDGSCFLSDLGQVSLKPLAGENATGDVILARSDLARAQHQELADPEFLIWFLLQHADRIEQIVRPPFLWLKDLPQKPGTSLPQKFRDPRNSRDRAFDMRMPPYMRDSDFSALSITRRQWQDIHDFIALLRHRQVSKTTNTKTTQ